MFKLVKVKGDSMQPCYRHNDYILISKSRRKQFTVGDDVVCQHPHLGLILKRIVDINSGKLKLAGLNSLSSSPKDLGDIHKHDVIGRVIWHVRSKGKNTP